MITLAFCRGSGFLAVLLMRLVANQVTVAQVSSDDVSISYGIKSWDPVKIKDEERVSPGNDSPVIRFTATNSTYHRFSLLIDFEQFQNLFPKPSARPVNLSHGPNNLYSFSVHVPGKAYGYSYSYSYWLSPSDGEINERFPYLIPLTEGKAVISKRNSAGMIEGSFAVEIGDTVYCMRRGLVTAVPHIERLDFRLSPHDCLEVLHDDGTYMIYQYLSKKDNFTAPGQIILPGQPVGTVSDSTYFTVTLLKIEEEKNMTTSLPVYYVTGETAGSAYEELDGRAYSTHPYEILTLEMKGSEIKRASKGKKK